MRLRQGGDTLGSCDINTSGPGTVGPCEIADTIAAAHRPLVRWALVHLALEHLGWLGYAYGLLNIGEHTDGLPPAVADAAWQIPLTTGRTRAASRDDPSLKWADFFIDLRTWSPRDKPATLHAAGRELVVRRPEASEGLLLVEWIKETFGGGWASEIHRSFSRDPISSVIVVDQDTGLPAKERLIGFVAYDTARLGMLSTIALIPSVRGHSLELAPALLEECLRQAKASGMPYAVLGGVANRLTALRYINALWTIPGSYPGIFGKGIRN
ncbi:GNAT family N-acetyltransferase [Streptomyces clavuligerus]|uniref:GNAT family N-acetyltransferase n=1 Tax=Streptomyces clavuligerus TaxID=1901 RepID=UPI0022ABE5B7|nr:GNAT family N-acetyltransferase [Streptomyces clavuligerus]